MFQKFFTVAAAAVLFMLTACKKEEPTVKGLPELTTREITNVRASSATGGGNVVSQGASLVTTRGICWSTNPNPTVDNPSTTDGSGSGMFASALSNLRPSTTYYVRAYAANASGIGYGNQVSFTTAVQPTSDFWTINERLFQTNQLGAVWNSGTKALAALSVTQGGVFAITFKDRPAENGLYRVKDAVTTRQADLGVDECFIVIISPGVPNIFSSAEDMVNRVTVTVNSGKINVNFQNVDFQFTDGSGTRLTKGSAVIPEK